MGQVQSSEKHPGERKMVKGLPSEGGAVRSVTLQGPSSPSARGTPPNTHSHLPLPPSFTRSGHAFPHFGVSLGPPARKRKDSRRGSADALNALNPRLASRPHSGYFLISGYRRGSYGVGADWVPPGASGNPPPAPAAVERAAARGRRDLGLPGGGKGIEGQGEADPREGERRSEFG